MGDLRGFLKFKREYPVYRPVCERLSDHKEVAVSRPDKTSEEQSSRCMDCGTPFCHLGCPTANLIPEWNDLVFHKHWKKALELLHATNNLPEITGRLCPALCEYACVLGINDDPVTIRENELAVIEHGFKNGLIKAVPVKKRTSKRIAVIGSGPAGLSCADQLNMAGHKVTVFEKDHKVGGILRYGIPDFKLEKWVIDRRVKLFKKEGVEFVTDVNVGVDLKFSKLRKDYDAVCLAGGSRVPRDLKIEGRNLEGIHFAMDFLTQANLKASGAKASWNGTIDAGGRRVVVIGGGDTGADCVGTSLRQGAKCVTQIEVMPKPPECRTDDFPWPIYPLLLKTTSSHEEGGERHWSVLTKKFIGENGRLTKLSCTRVEFSAKDQKLCPIMKEVPGSEFEIEADMAILAVGFLQPEHAGLLDSIDVEYDPRGNVKTDCQYMTSIKGVFSAGDMHRGQSLIVWAISEGRTAAHYIDKYLMGSTRLPVL